MILSLATLFYGMRQPWLSRSHATTNVADTLVNMRHAKSLFIINKYCFSTNQERVQFFTFFHEFWKRVVRWAFLAWFEFLHPTPLKT